ncbi:hypothetical protein GA0115253_1096727 [Streptomyces sp. Termitarium-T10T-6]|nr:hypothetical protein GA0115253_1096727 [Streptomyces sp. Termitarium-T10T-6]
MESDQRRATTHRGSRAVHDTTGRAVTHDRVGRPGRTGPSAGTARRCRPGRRCAGHRRVRRQAAGPGLEDDARLAVHRTARFRPVHGGAGVRRRAPVHEPGPGAGRSPRLRLLRRLPHEPGRYARRRRGHPHGPALHRCEGDPGPGQARPALPGGRAVAGHRHGGRRPPHRGCGQRPAEGRRGARAAHGLDAVRPLARRRPAHDPFPLPAPHPEHPAGGGRGRRPDPPRRHRPRAGAQRGARHPGARSGGPAVSPRTSGRGRGGRRC